MVGGGQVRIISSGSYKVPRIKHERERERFLVQMRGLAAFREGGWFGWINWIFHNFDCSHSLFPEEGILAGHGLFGGGVV